MTVPLLATLPEPLRGLADLALDLRWVYTFPADALWSRLDPETWAITRNPWLILQMTPPRQLEELARDGEFRALLERELSTQRRALAEPTPWQSHPGRSELSCVAYFSLEFGLSDALPLYSGGLGILAGDQLKAANDLGVPVVGVGLLYQQGYFRQSLDPNGNQVEFYPYNDPSHLPVTPADAENGGMRLAFDVPGRRLWVRVWEARVGRVRLYLLDTNDPLNTPADRGITSVLYGGGSELRLEQEILLGLGGWELLRRLGLRPEVCHLNEGHAAFAALARAASFMREHKVPFEVALTATRAGNVFTTHTPVDAGFDRFDPALVRRYFTGYSEAIGLGIERLLALGRARPDDPDELFNMAYLALRTSGTVNGVSRLHGSVSRRIFQSVFPRWPQAEVPIGHVTNGVHVPTWESVEIGERLARAGGEEHWIGSPRRVDEDLRLVTDAQLWSFRGRQRAALVAFVRERYGRQCASGGESAACVEDARRCFDPDVLTVGFARRFAPYKRPGLLLHDPDRLAALLHHPHRPVQLVVAGKAHPRDETAKGVIRAWAQFTRRPDVCGRAVFLADYDMVMAERLVEGVDLWINTPRRPLEASGTSGMKVLVNGGLNLSTLDGWWAEAWSPEVGWALGQGRDHGGDPAADAADALALYELLENDVVPTFYDRDGEGIPRRWVARMRASMVELTPRFSAERMVLDYTERCYLPAARAYRRRAADQGKLALEIETWRRIVTVSWNSVHVTDVHVESQRGRHQFEAHVSLGPLPQEAVRVELYAEPEGPGDPVRIVMQHRATLPGTSGVHRYVAAAPGERPIDDYTVRVMPYHPEARVPLEAPEILWQR
jgi:starch phosphorylase